MIVLVSTVSIWSIFHVLFSFAFTHSKAHVVCARDAIVLMQAERTVMQSETMQAERLTGRIYWSTDLCCCIGL